MKSIMGLARRSRVSRHAVLGRDREHVRSDTLRPHRFYNQLLWRLRRRGPSWCLRLRLYLV